MRAPDVEEVAELGRRLGFTLTAEEVDLFRPRIADTIAAAEALDSLERYETPVNYPRVPRSRSPRADDPEGNEWAWHARIEGADSGPLAGFDVALKDCIAVAGMPMSNGSALLEGYVPSIDAAVVTRLLDAGAAIVGAGACENLSFCSASVSSSSGMIRNPNDPRHSAGGSSSGVAALLASGQVRAAVGGDQGGSIRIPSSFCGVFGLKPTWGAVPYAGAASLDPVIDHLGPMASTAEDLARVFDAIAGPWAPYESDGRRSSDVAGSAATELETGIDGVRVSLLEEGFGWPEMSDPAVDDAVATVVWDMAGLGAVVDEQSVPCQRTALESLVPLFLQSIGEHMGSFDGTPVGHHGYYDTGLARAYASGWRTRADTVWPTMKVAMLYAAYMRRHHGSEYYGKAYNRGLVLRRAYDDALSRTDVLALPTTPIRASRLPAEDASLAERLDASLDPATFANTAITNVTGHPSLSVPIGPPGELPIGLQLIARRGEDALLLRAAHALERANVTRPRGTVATTAAGERSDDRE